LPIVSPTGGSIALADVAKVYIEDGPPFIKSENARLNGWSYISIEGRDLGSYIKEAQRVVAERLDVPPGYSVNWAGQFEYMERVKQRLSIVVPVTIAIIILLLYLNFRCWSDVLIILLTLPLAMVGSCWFLWWQNYEFSVAVAVGFIALAGVSVEIGILMLTYLHQAWNAALAENNKPDRGDLRMAVITGAGLRVRPIMMTVLATVIGLLPIMLGEGAGSEVMQRIAGPMIGGLLTALMLSLLLLPVVFYLWFGRKLPVEEGGR
jgi:Cu(I)/Ag(I) efflux system membrane protein CusA/SilA